MKDNQLMLDLTNHLSDRIDKAVLDAVAIVDNDSDVLNILIAALGAMINSVERTLAANDSPYVLYKKLPERKRLQCVTIIAGVMVGRARGLKPGDNVPDVSPQGLSDLTAALRELGFSR